MNLDGDSHDIQLRTYAIRQEVRGVVFGYFCSVV